MTMIQLYQPQLRIYMDQLQVDSLVQLPLGQL